MALYTILFGISIFLIALVVAIIKKMFFHWKQEHKIESMRITTVERPAVSMIIYTDKCVLKRRVFADNLSLYDTMSSDISLSKNNLEHFDVKAEPNECVNVIKEHR